MANARVLVSSGTAPASRWLWPLAVLLALACCLRPAHAGFVLGEPILGGQLLVANDGYVTAEFLGTEAGYFNSLYLQSPGDGDRFVFDKMTPPQAVADLGWFAGGTELIFRLDVRDTQQSFFTGSASRNPDGLAHAEATTWLTEAGRYVTEVGFEDLLGGGDRDFNDFLFVLNNVIDPIPTPSVLALLGLGLLGLAYQRRRAARR